MEEGVVNGVKWQIAERRKLLRVIRVRWGVARHGQNVSFCFLLRLILLFTA
jgi:hypothetical protein